MTDFWVSFISSNTMWSFPFNDRFRLLKKKSTNWCIFGQSKQNARSGEAWKMNVARTLKNSISKMSQIRSNFSHLTIIMSSNVVFFLFFLASEAKKYVCNFIQLGRPRFFSFLFFISWMCVQFDPQLIYATSAAE